ncbi:hypothetical protein [Buttiauxella izardii]|uniref:hypothetical protein n=1 Tax=Buttiauxella izardii TaxID=82991 RepID=UPI00142E3E20|nr:hypothetical protein [Buttiauxella izardii]
MFTEITKRHAKTLATRVRTCLTDGKEGKLDRIREPLHVQGCKKIERDDKKIN